MPQSSFGKESQDDHHEEEPAPVTLPYEAQLPAHLSYESAAARATGRISLLLSSSPFALLPPAHLSVPPFGLASLLASDTIYQHRGHHVEPPSNIAEKPFVVQKAVVVNQYKADYSREKERRQMRPPVLQVGNYKRFETSIPKDAELVLIPTQQDVVFGRGKGSHDRPGNLRMRAIIRSHKNEYAEARKSKKREIAELVYSEITQDGARFLYQNQEKNAYAIVTLNLALQKLSNTLRCRKSCI
ncbi:unnamed protein product [Cylindrotheca closterium]|uniref:DUF6824 domain-containing protein n=1 Tax=Cylindrotheca closterium TaxID=2856 RepID=A0AAD2PXH6_9STRA|nr:unnamed protein product [Cylindrotheca closterium]